MESSKEEVDQNQLKSREREPAVKVRVSRIERRASRESVRVLVRPEEWRGGEHS